MPLADEPRAVRPDDELDIAAVEDYLRRVVPDLEGALEVRQYPSGASNLTYLLTIGERELVLRRPPVGTKAKSAHDMGREVRVMTALRTSFPYVPEVVAFCEDHSVLGCDFYVMERIPGIILRRELPRGLVLSEPETRQLCTNVLDRLIELHTLDYRAAGLGDFGKPEGYVERQIRGWSDRYVKARTPNAPSYEKIIEWLVERMPGEVRHSVIHGDFRFDNVVLDSNDPFRVVGVLDWEMATIGDPLMDLGNSLAYWIDGDDPLLLRIFRLQPTHLPGMFSRDEVIDYYLERTGISCDDFTFYRVYGVFRLVVIMQQIYYRYHHKQTSNKRFKKFIWLVKYLHRYLKKEIKRR
ncbi:MAG: phosphotransferase family protein [Acidimicrobiales bacterium]|nr:MAG: phosphotransferase family protein [Acidimicrobiales bacterium]